jgi:hypothetical protein
MSMRAWTWLAAVSGSRSITIGWMAPTSAFGSGADDPMGIVSSLILSR